MQVRVTKICTVRPQSCQQRWSGSSNWATEAWSGFYTYELHKSENLPLEWSLHSVNRMNLSNTVCGQADFQLSLFLYVYLYLFLTKHFFSLSINPRYSTTPPKFQQVILTTWWCVELVGWVTNRKDPTKLLPGLKLLKHLPQACAHLFKAS